MVRASAQIDYYIMLRFVDDSFGAMVRQIATSLDIGIAFNSGIMEYLNTFLQKYAQHQTYIESFYNQMQEYALATSEKLEKLTAMQAAEIFTLQHQAVLDLTLTELELADKTDIETALSAFEQLSAEAKPYLTTQKAHLDALLAKIDVISAQQNQAAADAVIALIETIPMQLTLADAARIELVRSVYDQLSDPAKALVSNYSVLTGAEQDIQGLISTAQQADEDVQAFKTTHAAILLLTVRTVTSDDKLLLEAAMGDYDELDADAKALLAGEIKLLNRLDAKITDLINQESAAAFILSYEALLALNANQIGIEYASEFELIEQAIQTAQQELVALEDGVKAYLTEQNAHLLALTARIELLKEAVSEIEQFLLDNSAILSYEDSELVAAHRELVVQALADYEQLGEIAKQTLIAQRTRLNVIDATIAYLEGDEVAEIILAIVELEAIDWDSDESLLIVADPQFVEAIELLMESYNSLSSENKLRVYNIEALIMAQFMCDVYLNVYLPTDEIYQKGYDFYGLIAAGFDYLLANYDEILQIWGDLDESLTQLQAEYGTSQNPAVSLYLEYLQMLADEAQMIGQIISISNDYYQIFKNIPDYNEIDETNYSDYMPIVYQILSMFSATYTNIELWSTHQVALYLIGFENETSNGYVAAISKVQELAYIAEEPVFAFYLSYSMLVEQSQTGYFSDSFDQDIQLIEQAKQQLSPSDLALLELYFPHIDAQLEYCKTAKSFLTNADDPLSIIIEQIYDLYESITWSGSLRFSEIMSRAYQIRLAVEQLDEERSFFLQYSYWNSFEIIYEQILGWNMDMIKLYDDLNAFGEVTPDKLERAYALAARVALLGDDGYTVVYFCMYTMEVYSNILALIEMDTFFDSLSQTQIDAFNLAVNLYHNTTIDNVEQAKQTYDQIEATLYEIPLAYIEYFRTILNRKLNDITTALYLKEKLDLIDDVQTYDFVGNSNASEILETYKLFVSSKQEYSLKEHLPAADYAKMMELYERVHAYFLEQIDLSITAVEAFLQGDELSDDIIKGFAEIKLYASWVFEHEVEKIKQFFDAYQQIAMAAASDILAWQNANDEQELVPMVLAFGNRFCSDSNFAIDIFDFLIYQNQESENYIEVLLTFEFGINLVADYFVTSDQTTLEQLYIVQTIIFGGMWHGIDLNDASSKIYNLMLQIQETNPDPRWSPQAQEIFLCVVSAEIDIQNLDDLDALYNSAIQLDNIAEMFYHSNLFAENLLLIESLIQHAEFLDSADAGDPYDAALIDIYAAIEALCQKSISLTLDDLEEFSEDFNQISTKISDFDIEYESEGLYFSDVASAYIQYKWNQASLTLGRFSTYSFALYILETHYNSDWIADKEILLYSIASIYDTTGLEEAIGAEDYAKIVEMYQALRTVVQESLSDLEYRFDSGEITAEEAFSELYSELYYLTWYYDLHAEFSALEAKINQ